MKSILWVFVAGLALVLSLPAAAAQGKGRAAAKGKADNAARKGAQDEEREKQAAQGRAFGKEHIRIIREWFADGNNLRGLPPGLAKRGQLPPGLQRHLERDGTLPPGLQKRVHPLPAVLERRLPRIPRGIRRVVVAGNVILLEERTARILDIIEDVVGSRKSGRATTGVRRVEN